jgi:hypothetical protein
LNHRMEALAFWLARHRSGLASAGVESIGGHALKPATPTALVKFWESWQDELGSVRLLDPACGSGAFLIEAFDQLHAAYQPNLFTRLARLHDLALRTAKA